MRKKEGRLLYANVFILALAALLYTLLGSKYAVPAMANYAGGPVYRTSSKDSVSLQCIISWDAAALPGILRVLKENDVRITFAVSGVWAEEHPELLKTMQSEGHEIAVMGREPDKDGDAGFVRADVLSSLDTVESLTGVRPVTYYCGSRNPSVSASAGKKLGVTTVLCTIDLDCASADAELVLKRLKGNAPAGSIIDIQPTQSLYEALPQIINYLKNIGSAIVPTYKMLYN